MALEDVHVWPQRCFGFVNQEHCCIPETKGRSGFSRYFKSWQRSQVDPSPPDDSVNCTKMNCCTGLRLTDVPGRERGDFARAAGVEEGGDQKIGLDSAKTVRCQ